MADQIRTLTEVTEANLNRLTHRLITQADIVDDPFEGINPALLCGQIFDASAGTPAGNIAGSFTPSAGTGSIIKWKVVPLTTKPNAGTANNAHGLTGDFRVVKIDAFFKNTSSNEQICLPHLDTQTSTNNMGIKLDATNVILDSAGDYTSANWVGYAIVYYYEHT